MTAPLDLARLKALCDAATRGPWHHRNKVGYVYGPECVTATCGDFHDKELVPFNGERWNADAAFIAAARDAVPALLDMIEHLTSGVREMTLAAGEANARAEKAEAALRAIIAEREQT